MDAFAFPVDAGNASRPASGDGADGECWATYHREYERLLGVFDDTLVRGRRRPARRPVPRHRLRDRGHDPRAGGTRRAGSALGVDLSGPMLADRPGGRRAGTRPPLTYVQGDAQVYPFEPASFDVAVSRMGCMFFADPAAALAQHPPGPPPGGRLALTVWQRSLPTSGSPPSTAPSARRRRPRKGRAGYVPGPFSLADPELCVVPAGASRLRRRQREGAPTYPWPSGPWPRPRPSSRRGSTRISTTRDERARSRRCSGS